MSAQLAQARAAFTNCPAENYWNYIGHLEKALAAFEAAPQQEPFAWATHHEEPMLFPTYAEAAQYCEDDEEPVALYAAPQQAQAPNLHAMQMLWDDQSSEERAHYMAVAARIANEDAAQQQIQQSQEQP